MELGYFPSMSFVDYMGRKRDSKPEGKKRRRYSEENLKIVIAKMEAQEPGYRSARVAAEISGIPRWTLQRYMKQSGGDGELVKVRRVSKST